ncbi:MAG: hypothetical protein U0169_15990 [Polyangiaceae bacterium]
MLGRLWIPGALGLLLAACGSGGAVVEPETTPPASGAGTGAAPGDDRTAATPPGSDAGMVATADSGPSAADDAGSKPAAPTEVVTLLHANHRYVPNAMFGGWGPHLGHLVRRHPDRATDELWFVDDACAPGTCNVLANGRLDYLKFEAGTWKKIDSMTLPAGVQQNTGTILVKDTAFTYGLSTGGALWECSRVMSTGVKRCSAVTSATGSGANYVGAAVSPKGTKMAWYTNVVDGGGGSFSFFAEYGNGWNGPRVGNVGGYNDVGYINVAFGIEKDPNRFVLHGQFVNGLAPNWGFAAGTAEGDISKANAVGWGTPLVPPPGETIMSTNDVLVDPDTGDTHLVARTRVDNSVYYFRPRGGAWTRLDIFPKTLRARLVLLDDKTIALAQGPAKGGLSVTFARPDARTPGKPIPWSTLPTVKPTLPPGYEDLMAIYPEATVYQDTDVPRVELAIVGEKKQSEVTFVAVALP